MKAYTVKGTTDEVTTCELCGKAELKGTVVLATLDADGNEDGGVCYFGVSCAAKAAGWTQREVRAGVKAAEDSKRAAEWAAREARWAAEREWLASWYLENYGTPKLQEAAEIAGVSTVRLSGEAIHAYREFQRATEAVAEETSKEESAKEMKSAAVDVPVESRSTTLRVGNVERVVRTVMEGRVNTTKRLETAHTAAVKASIVEMRTANVPAYESIARAAELKATKNPGDPWAKVDAKRARNVARRAERGTTSLHTSTWAADLKPFPKVRFTDEIPAGLVEIEPGHYATHEAAEQLSFC